MANSALAEKYSPLFLPGLFTWGDWPPYAAQKIALIAS